MAELKRKLNQVVGHKRHQESDDDESFVSVYGDYTYVGKQSKAEADPVADNVTTNTPCIDVVSPSNLQATDDDDFSSVTASEYSSAFTKQKGSDITTSTVATELDNMSSKSKQSTLGTTINIGLFNQNIPFCNLN